MKAPLPGATVRIELDDGPPPAAPSIEANARSDAMRPLPQWQFVADGTGDIVAVAPEWHALTGTPPGSAAGQGLFQVFHGEDRDALVTAWRNAIDRGLRLDREARLRHADGSYRLVCITAARLVPEDGLVRWAGLIEDHDDRRRMHDEAMAAEQRYRLAMRATQDLIWDHDVLTDELRLGEAISTVFGYPLMEGTVPLDWWLALVHPDDREEIERSYRAAYRQTRTDWAGEYRLRRSDGSYAFVSDRAFIVRDESGRPVRVVGAASDLSAEREAEQRLGELQAELIRVSRISEIGAMASILAHELNQPLTAVTAYVRGVQRLLARGDAAAMEKATAAMDAAADSALAAGAIVRRLHDLVTRGESRIGVHSLPDMIEDARALALLDARKWNVRDDVVLDPSMRLVAVDRVQVQQVLVNLMRNAVEAMHGAETCVVTIRTLRSGDFAEIVVADTGHGISADRQALLFKPFSTTKHGGMGVGLSICRIIVEANGGRIWLARSGASGTEFRFTLPLADEED